MRASHAGVSPARSRRGEAGETLLETIMSVLLISTVVLAVIFSLFTVMRTTRAHRQIVRSGNESVTVAEQLRTVAYQPCGASTAPLAAYQGLVTFSVTGYEAEISRVRFLKARSATAPAGGDSFQAACPATDQGVQELTVRLSPTDNDGVAQSLTFYKRSSECPEQNREFEGQLC